ncbi:adhesion G-protein coupled receptor G2 [Pelodytes ibericus]
MNWINALYNTPQARIRINGQLSEPVTLSNGTRQGCPLSPLLFVLSIEPLINAIRANPDISGIQVGPHHHKVTAYADDLLFTLTNPLITLPNLMRELDTYGALSNFKVNMEKSVALNINFPQDTVDSLASSFPFKWAATSFTYLGITVTADLQHLYTKNYIRILNVIKTDLAKWTTKHLSWFGKASVIKMNILPRLLYIIQTLPILVPRTFFINVKRMITKFIWNSKGPRLGYQYLVRNKDRGGLGLPDVESYYKATLLSRIVEWSIPAKKLWVSLEQRSLNVPIPIAAWVPDNQKVVADHTHPTVPGTIKLWKNLKGIPDLINHPTPLLSIIENVNFQRGASSSTFRDFFHSHTPYPRLGHFVQNGQIKEITTLTGVATNTPLNRFLYAQVRQYIQSLPGNNNPVVSLTTMESLCLESEPQRRLISTLHSLLVNIKYTTKPYFIREWEADCKVDLTDSQWKKIATVAHKCSASANIQENAYKIMTRWYKTPSKIHNIFPNVSDRCWRCANNKGDFLHIWWTCSKIQPFWKAIADILTEVAGAEIPFEPCAYLLHHNTQPISKYKKSLTIHLLNAAKLLIPRLWKTSRTPSFREWLAQVEDIRSAEDLMLTSQAQLVNFGEYKTVFKTPCEKTIRLNISIPDLSQFTLCTYIKLSSYPWTAFTYKLPMSKSNGYELGLFGDSGLINIWMFDTLISVDAKLNMNTWHETCINWDAKNGSMFYLDGTPKDMVNVSNKILSNKTTLTGDGTLILGCPQEGNSSTSLGLVGQLYMFRMWNTTEKGLVQSCKNGNVIRWTMSDWIYNTSAIERDPSLHCGSGPSGYTSSQANVAHLPLGKLTPGPACHRLAKEMTNQGTVSISGSSSSNEVSSVPSITTSTTSKTINGIYTITLNCQEEILHYGRSSKHVTFQAEWTVESEEAQTGLPNSQWESGKLNESPAAQLSNRATKATDVSPLNLALNVTWVTGVTFDVVAKNTGMSYCTFMMKGYDEDQICTLLHEKITDPNIILKIRKNEYCCCPTEDVCPVNITDFHSLNCTNDISVDCSGFGSSTSSTSGSSNAKTTSIHFTSTKTTPNELNRLNDTLSSGNLNSSIVDSIVSEIEHILSGEVNPDNAVLLVGVLNTFLNISQDLITPVSKRLILIVDKIGLNLIFPGQSINITSNSLALAVNKVNATVFSETSFGVDKSTSGLQVSLGSRESPNNEGNIVLPASLMDGLTPDEQENTSRIQFNFFEKTSLFTDLSLLGTNKSLVSRVISASVGNFTIANLTENITVTLPLINAKTNVSFLCVFWNFKLNGGQGGWSSDGCTVASITHNTTICKCNHLTSFAILMDVSKTTLSPEDTLILTFITYIGCGISAIFLSVTLVTYIAFEKIRRDYPSKILIQLCAALVCVNLTFLLNPWIALYSDIPGLCISVAAFLHYFLLVSITWMGLEALHMYLSLVKVFNTYVRKYMLKFCIIGWGVPAVVVAIILAVNKNLYNLQISGTYPNGSSDYFCWIDDIVFYITVIGYFGIIFLLNISMFVVVLIQLCRIKKQKQLGYQRKTTFQDLRSVAGITFLLGITWGLGFFSWGPGKVVIVYLFTIFNTLQGFFIFIFYCVAKENVRKQWRRYLCCGKFRLPENSDWSKTATNKLKKQTSKHGASSSSSNSIQSTSNSNSTTLLVANEYCVHPNGNGYVFKERNGVSFMVQNGEVGLHDFPVGDYANNGGAKRPSVKRTSNRGSVQFADSM